MVCISIIEFIEIELLSVTFFFFFGNKYMGFILNNYCYIFHNYEHGVVVIIIA